MITFFSGPGTAEVRRAFKNKCIKIMGMSHKKEKEKEYE